ncbi:MAG TPA: hypothetical protein VF188_06525 [Longimicrobiales bacterium]
MSRFTPVFRLLAAGTILYAVACADVPDPTAPEDADAFDASGAFRATPPEPSVLVRTVPGFGGLFLDADGVPTVYLTESGDRGAAERALAAFMRARGFAPSELRVRRGAFTYERLDGWFRQGSPEVLDVPGAVFVDLDEANNRLLVGVEHAAAGNGVRAALARRGVPPDAIEIRETEPIYAVATLRDFVRPVEGGLQFHFSNFLCTMGFNAIRGGEDSFITNSHCTDRQGGTEGTEYFQPLSTVANSFIGTEVDDPTYFRRGDCPRGRRCRYSDSSRAEYASGVSFDLGAIARTASRGNLSGSLNIVGTFTITGEQADPLVGEELNKVGRTTGWTFGQVTNTCVDTNVSGTNITQLCQSFVAGGVGSGDSGSPVFAWPGSGSDVTLYGILWGGNSAGTLFVFSPLSGIERELGSLTTF